MFSFFWYLVIMFVLNLQFSSQGHNQSPLHFTKNADYLMADNCLCSCWRPSRLVDECFALWKCFIEIVGDPKVEMALHGLLVLGKWILTLNRLLTPMQMERTCSVSFRCCFYILLGVSMVLKKCSFGTLL